VAAAEEKGSKTGKKATPAGLAGKRRRILARALKAWIREEKTGEKEKIERGRGGIPTKGDWENFDKHWVGEDRIREATVNWGRKIAEST